MAPANTYSGGTQINGGVLNFVFRVAARFGNISFGGGTLQWATGNTQDVSAGIPPIPAGKPARLDTNGNNVTFASPLNGGGGLTKIGSGTLTLNATASYAGHLDRRRDPASGRCCHEPGNRRSALRPGRLKRGELYAQRRQCHAVQGHFRERQ